MTQPYAGANKGRQGQMTAVMRALPQATGPKVLRIGIVQSGRVVEERVVKQRSHVTIGPNEKCMFVLSAAGLPSIHKLFELVGTHNKGEYVLNYLDGMSGRVALQTGIADLETLKSQAKRGAGNAYQVRLTEDSRGKVVVGDTTLLFQFVAPPPVQPKPQLPVSVQSGLSSQIDWRFTIIASFSFLLHFGSVGMLYSDWMDPVVNEEVAISALMESMRSVPPPQRLPDPVEDPNSKPEANAATADATAAQAGGPKNQQGSGKPSGGGKPALSDSQFGQLSNELDQLEMATIGALSKNGSATSGVLGSGDLPTGDLTAIAGQNSGVGSTGFGNLGVGGRGGPIVPGAGGMGLGGIGQTGGGGPATAGSAVRVEGPKINVGASAAVAGASVNNAQRVVSGMSAGFRRCYMNGLASNPEMSGSVRVTARIGPGGEVIGVTATPSGTITGDVASCIASRVQSAQFDPPEGGGTATVNIPVTLVQQKP